MAEPINEVAIALWLIQEALRLLDSPQYDRAAGHLRAAIEELSSGEQESLPPASDRAEPPGQ